MDFSAESRGCAPCLLLSPQLELIAKEYEGRMRVVKIDTDKCLALTSAMKVYHHPESMIANLSSTSSSPSLFGRFIITLDRSRISWIRFLYSKLFLNGCAIQGMEVTAKMLCNRRHGRGGEGVEFRRAPSRC